MKEILNKYLELAYLQTNTKIPDKYATYLAAAMKEFGKLCFDAGRENKTKYNPTKEGKLYQISIIPEYNIFEDFLKEIENEKE